MNGPSAFERLTLREMITLAVIVALFAIVVAPAFGPPGYRPRRVASLAQLNAISTAADSYTWAFGVPPGYAADRAINADTASDFTGNESLVLSLLGRVVPRDQSANRASFPGNQDETYASDLNQIGMGPRTVEGKQYGAFYAPRPNEFGVIRGTTGDDNQIPELLDVMSHVPILYYRIDPQRKADTVGDWYDGEVGVGRKINRDYFDAATLVTPSGDKRDQTGSLLRSDRDGGAHAANKLLGDLAYHRTSGNRGGAWLLISPGKDGVYFSEDEDPGRLDLAIDEYLKSFDDIVLTGGREAGGTIGE